MRSSAKSIIMIAFFFTTPTNIIEADKRIQTDPSEQHQRQSAPRPAEGKPDIIVIG